MTNDDDAAFAAELIAVAELYDRAMSPAAIALYFEALRELDLADIRRALRRYVRSGPPFMPKPADVFRLLGHGHEDMAIEAWGRVRAAMSSVGRYRSVDFGPAANAAVMDAGGWIRVCETPTDRLGYVEAAFKKAVAAYIAAGVPDGRGAPLVGIEDLDRQRCGLQAGPPVRRLPPGTQRALPTPDGGRPPSLPPAADAAIGAVTQALTMEKKR